MTRIR